MFNEAPDTQKKYSGVLCIKDLELNLNIGIGEEERSQKQLLKLEIEVFDPPLGEGDDYSQVVCYDEVICKIFSELEGNEFKLIEFLARFIMNLLEKNFFPKNNIILQVCKRPVIKGTQRNIEFKLKNF